jgi:hypothetical protein
MHMPLMPSMPTPHHTPQDITPQAIAVFDGRPFFEKALQHGVRHGIIGPAKLAAMCQEAPKGMVQIARYFGTEYLRPDLELARDRLINLVSLYLEHSSGGDLDQAAQSLRDHSLLSRSKGGSDMLKALIAMPQTSHFGMQANGVFENKHIPLLAKWSLRSLHEYHAERTARSHATTLGGSCHLDGGPAGSGCRRPGGRRQRCRSGGPHGAAGARMPTQHHAGLGRIREDGGGSAQEICATSR